MYSLQVQQFKSSRMDINSIIYQLSNKMGTLKLKQDKIRSILFKCSNIQSQLKSSQISDLKKQITEQLLKNHQYNQRYLIQACSNYELQIEQQKCYYQYEIQQLKSQIHRQYKVIGLMKQQVEDLMILLNQQHSNRISQQQQYRSRSGNVNSLCQSDGRQGQQNRHTAQLIKKDNCKLDLRGNLIGQLETIIQQQTERTFVSNYQLNQLDNQQFCEHQRQQPFNEQMQQLQHFQKQKLKLQADKYQAQVIKQKKPKQIQFSKQNFIRIDENNSTIQSQLRDQHHQFQQQRITYYLQHQKYAQLPPTIFLKQIQNQTVESHHKFKSNSIIQHKQLQQNQSVKNQIEQYSLVNQASYVENRNLRDSFIQSNQCEQWAKKGIFQYIDCQQGYQGSCQNSSRNSKMQQPLQIDYSDRNNYNVEQKSLQYCESKKERLIEKQKQLNALQYLQSMFNNGSKTKANSRSSFNSNNNSSRQLKNIDFNLPISYKKDQFGTNNSKLQGFGADDQTDIYSNKKNNNKSTGYKGKQNMQFYKKNIQIKQNKAQIKRGKQVQGIQSQSKTKQFLQEFRKTFNKCLNAIQVTKKHSTKIIKDKSLSKIQNNFDFDFLPSPAYTQNQKQYISSQHNLNQDEKSISPQSNCSPKKCRSLQATFGKNKKSIQKERKSFQNKKSFLKKGKKININESFPQQLSDNKHYTSESVNTMLKDLQNNNRFLVGSKQLQLKFQGQKRQGQRNGNGILHYSNGLWYQGQFKSNLRCGYGILRFNHIQLYNGEWKDDQLHGQGKIRNCAIINKKKTTQNNSSGHNSALSKWISYCGYFKNSRFQGEGTLYLQGGQKFTGSFSGGNANGQGTLYRKNGQVQMGTWKHNVFIENF